MDIRFMVKDQHGKIHGWRIQSDRTQFTLTRYSGLSEGEKSAGEERWGGASFPSSFAQAVNTMMREGMRTFPGTISEIIETSARFEKNILELLSPMATRSHSQRLIADAILAVDADLKIFEAKDGPIAAHLTTEEEDADFDLDDDDPDEELSFD